MATNNSRDIVLNFLQVNQAIKKGIFPKQWKKAKLVLIEKPRKELTNPISYRPICLLNSMAKILEAMICRRIEEELEEKGGLSQRQFGFRKGRSTIDAMEAVQQALEAGTRKKNNRGFCVLVTIDVKNAFNTVRWQRITEAMQRKGISGYLTNIVKNYLQGRLILVGSKSRRYMKCGVPQGSKLGPLLWNINYDGVLENKLPNGATLVGYADDLALIVTGWTFEELKVKVDWAMDLTISWLETNGLEIAPHKTESVMLAGRRTIRSMTVGFRGHEVKTKNSPKYLGVHYDKDMRMREHIKATAEKANQVMSKLARLMPNINGPRASKRKTLSSVLSSILLYAAPAWERAMSLQKYRNMYIATQRRVAIRICSAYRTISTPAVQVIAGLIPIDLMVEERVEIHKRGKEQARNTRAEIEIKWLRRWRLLLDKAQWTKRLIPNPITWSRRSHGELDFHLTQLLSGHGCFQAYLERFKRSDCDRCVYCGDRDTAEHTFFACPRWGRSRLHLEVDIGVHITPDNIVSEMLQEPGKWKRIAKFVNDLLQKKEEDERRRQKRAA